MAPHDDLIDRLGDRFDMVVDGPLVLAMAAAGLWPMLVRDLGGLPLVAQNTPAELSAAWAASVPGTEAIKQDELDVMPMPPGTPGKDEPALVWRPLASAWQHAATSDARCNALAAAFVTAQAAKVPFLTHAPEAWRAVRGRLSKMDVIGMVECLHASVRAGRHDAESAWSLYTQIARSAAGPQQGWSPVDGQTRKRFLAAMK